MYPFLTKRTDYFIKKRTKYIFLENWTVISQVGDETRLILPDLQSLFKTDNKRELYKIMEM
jgi:hypothetical protein